METEDLAQVREHLRACIYGGEEFDYPLMSRCRVAMVEEMFEMGTSMIGKKDTARLIRLLHVAMCGLDAGQLRHALPQVLEQTSHERGEFFSRFTLYSDGREWSPLLIEHVEDERLDPEKALWFIGFDRRAYAPECADRVAAFVKAMLEHSAPAVRAASAECAMRNPHPKLRIPLAEVARDRMGIKGGSRSGELHSILAALLMSIWWPKSNGPEDLERITAILEALPVSLASAQLAQEDDRRSWSDISPKESEAMVSDALKRDYQRLHQWCERSVSGGDIPFTLNEFIRCVVGGCNSEEPGAKVAVVEFLAEFECDRLRLVGDLVSIGAADVGQRELLEFMLFRLAETNTDPKDARGVLQAVPELVSEPGLRLASQLIAEARGTGGDGSLEEAMRSLRGEIARKLRA